MTLLVFILVLVLGLITVLLVVPFSARIELRADDDELGWALVARWGGGLLAFRMMNGRLPELRLGGMIVRRLGRVPARKAKPKPRSRAKKRRKPHPLEVWRWLRIAARMRHGLHFRLAISGLIGIAVFTPEGVSVLPIPEKKGRFDKLLDRVPDLIDKVKLAAK